MTAHVAAQTQSPLLTSRSISSNQLSLYGHPSPTQSARTSPSDNSPTSSRLSIPTLHGQLQLQLQTRQLRPPKVPLYVPAALRPTERPQKASPPTPPRSVHGSLDSWTDAETVESTTRRSSIQRAANALSSKITEEELMKHEPLAKVTGLPTRHHWKADAASPTCDSPTCRSSFGLFLRRHHCRHCGHVFCSSHTPHLVPLNQDAQFHPNGILSRACDMCWSAYQRWLEARSNRLSQARTEVETPRAGDNSPDDSHSDSGYSEASQDDGYRPALPAQIAPNSEIAASVPRDWNWSTF